MSKRFPSLAALLGLVAVAGYQNRDKIGDFIKTMTGGSAKLPDGTSADQSTIKGGLGELIDSFRKAGQGDAADSWVASGPNKPVSSTQVESALGGDLLETLAKQTGLSRDDLLARLSKVLPEAVDKMTPDGRLPG